MDTIPSDNPRRKRKPHPPETPIHGNTGRKHTEETRKKISDARKGKTLSLEHRANISQSMKGYVKTPEHRTNLSKSNKGKKRTEEQRRVNGLARRGKKMSEEAKRQIGESIKGEKHWNWQGGKPKLKRFGDPHYYPWQKAVFERDNYTCQRCGYQNIHGDFLNAHHVKRWRDFPELRFEAANGITLCRPCHKREHGMKPRPQETVYCACNCGKPLNPDSVAYGHRFLPGHNSRGRKRPLSERQAISATLRKQRSVRRTAPSFQPRLFE